MSEKIRVYENLTGPLKASQAGADGVVGLGETEPSEVAARSADGGGGSSSAKPGVEEYSASPHASGGSGIARRSPTHDLEK
ncbi:hypothetical protein EDE15_2759 [Edaphobacter aggregans]|uniref:Uncharacterized protein n=1 Tax=Edaphobacter aggregans TaxID=570835 RepID=A0A428MK87_9BACT|nr:hypothetical protein EDE15_2759 [Edaphobacter aggregans]